MHAQSMTLLNNSVIFLFAPIICIDEKQDEYAKIKAQLEGIHSFNIYC